MGQNNTGKVFRRLREQREYPLSSFFLLGISKSALSKFERGESMMSFDKVVAALQYMGVSLEDFEQFINDYNLGEIDYLIDKIQSETFRQNSDKLLKLAQKANQLNFSYIALAAKSSSSELSFEEVEQITQYFYSIKHWSYKELSIFYFTMKDMATKDILYILNVFLGKGHELFQSTKARSYFVHSCCQAIALFSDRGYHNFAKYVLDKIDSHELVNTMFLRNTRNLVRGYWIYCFENKVEGNKMMLRALEILDSIGVQDVADYYHSKYDKFVSKE